MQLEWVQSQQTQAEPDEKVGEDRLEFLLISSFFRESLEETVLGAWSVMADSPSLHGRVPGLHTTALINSSPMCKDLCSSPRLCVQLLKALFQ